MRRCLKTLSFPGHALLVLFLSAACDDPARDQEGRDALRWADTPKPAIGPEFEDQDFLLTVRAASMCKMEGPMAPAKDKKRISVPLTIRAKTKRTVPVGALLFTLEDPQGHTFRPTLAGCSPSLLQTTIASGNEMKGEVAFDVPVSAHTFELLYEPFLIGREKVTARVKVPTSPP